MRGCGTFESSRPTVVAVAVSLQEKAKIYPAVPAEQRRPIRVLSLFDGIATGEGQPVCFCTWFLFIADKVNFFFIILKKHSCADVRLRV